MRFHAKCNALMDMFVSYTSCAPERGPPLPVISRLGQLVMDIRKVKRKLSLVSSGSSSVGFGGRYWRRIKGHMGVHQSYPLSNLDARGALHHTWGTKVFSGTSSINQVDEALRMVY